MLDTVLAKPKQPVGRDSPEYLALLAKYGDRDWRINNLYYVTDEDGNRVLYRRREAQAKFSEDSWVLDIIVKARQLGMSTEIAIEIIDLCVFKKNMKCGVIDLKLEDAKKKLQKIKFAYHGLPQVIRNAVTLLKENEDEVWFSNGSSVVVGTSHRGGSLNFLHVSEFGKIASEKPDAAIEIINGGFNTISPGNIIKVESTAHGTSGKFYELVQEAERVQKEGRQLTPLDFKLHFFGWYLDPKYVIPSGLVHVSPELLEYFAELNAKHGIKTSADQRAWYAQKYKLLGEDDMRSEFPSCVDGDELIATADGLIPMRDVQPDGVYITKKFDQGVKDVYCVTTELGYRVNTTLDHPFLCEDGKFRDLSDLGIGDSIALQKTARFPSALVSVNYNPLPFVTSSILIDEDMATFLGIYMGDGSFYDRCISIACDAQDTDLVEVVTKLLHKLTGDEPQTRRLGPKLGCSEVRIARHAFVEPLYALGVIRKNAGGKGEFKRKICVPEYIKRSPRHIARAFLSALFEADGFAQRNGSGIGFFGKDEAFVRDVQLLLLQFGITAAMRFNNKLLPNGKAHGGYSLNLRRAEAVKFAAEIGFLSKRKNARIALQKVYSSEKARRISVRHTLAISTHDRIRSIVSLGPKDVYDITTADHEFAAGGIVVHNCLDECFFNSLEGTWFKKELTKARQDGRIGKPLPHDPTRRVNTFWDKGINEKSDQNAIWFHQTDGVRHRFIDYYENAGEGIQHYCAKVHEVGAKRGFIYGTHYGPHDLEKREYVANAKTVSDVALELGIKFEIVPRILDKQDAIEAARRMLGLSWFDVDHTPRGVECLDNYRKVWSKILAQWTNMPYHNFASNAADALMTGAVGLKPEKVESAARYGAKERNRGSQWAR